MESAGEMQGNSGVTESFIRSIFSFLQYAFKDFLLFAKCEQNTRALPSASSLPGRGESYTHIEFAYSLEFW